ncbi:FUN14 family-domain-containing protein [Dioszegia hungarica]|uniref:FUN14 family-domain-containing protein n=1 Tax=Dioszegia hungarica TaxID=4972 RepID=A0AA38LVF8_9TREE|nr:FUN14 family-domain-containing protein [Dioszegia hungarica]KAI9637992.1 FUN14 family-domain-containing protein [Dioszegia hungarica]
MSFAPGLLPRLFPTSAPRALFRPAARSLHTSPSHSQSQSAAARFLASRAPAPVRAKAISIPRSLPRSSRNQLYTLGLGLSFVAYTAFSPSRSVQCQSATSPGGVFGAKPAASGRADDLPDSPASILSVSELGFGAVAGICAGVFLKKGLKALAFLLGGAFVFLQYMNSRSLVNVDWAKISSKYDETFGTRTSSGIRAPNVKGAYNWIVDFITANFQQRASFLAGFALGILNTRS